MSEVIEAQDGEAPALAPQPPPPTASKRVTELDGLRGIAILLVLLKHGTLNATELTKGAHRGLSFPMHALRWLFDCGWVGVDVFFVLSGYLITGILIDTSGNRHYYRNFIVRRALRILPLYYLFLLVCFIAARDVPHLGLIWFAAYVGNVRVFLENAWPPLAVLGPLWSLQVEEQFYLTFPWVVKKTSRRALQRILIASVAAALLFRIALQVAKPDNAFGTYVLMPARMDSLALGGLIAIAVRESHPILQSRAIAWIAAVCGIGFFALWKLPATFLQQTIGFSLVDFWAASLLILLITGRWPLLKAICRSRALVALGVVSYGMYMLQPPAFEAVNGLAGGLLRFPMGDLAEMLLGFAGAAAFAWASWNYFEAPILKLKDYFAPSKSLRAAQ